MLRTLLTNLFRPARAVEATPIAWHQDALACDALYMSVRQAVAIRQASAVEGLCDPYSVAVAARRLRELNPDEIRELIAFEDRFGPLTPRTPAGPTPELDEPDDGQPSHDFSGCVVCGGPTRAGAAACSESCRMDIVEADEFLAEVAGISVTAAAITVEEEELRREHMRYCGLPAELCRECRAAKPQDADEAEQDRRCVAVARAKLRGLTADEVALAIDAEERGTAARGQDPEEASSGEDLGGADAECASCGCETYADDEPCTTPCLKAARRAEEFAAAVAAMPVSAANALVQDAARLAGHKKGCNLSADQCPDCAPEERESAAEEAGARYLLHVARKRLEGLSYPDIATQSAAEAAAAYPAHDSSASMAEVLADLFHPGDAGEN